MSVHFIKYRREITQTGMISLNVNGKTLLGNSYAVQHNNSSKLLSIPISYYVIADKYNMLLRPVTSLYKRIFKFILPEVYIFVY